MLFFVVGATARDILLNHCHAIKSYRATRDLDIGVEVTGWDEFRQLFDTLIATGRFAADREPYRLMYAGFPSISSPTVESVWITGASVGRRITR